MSKRYAAFISYSHADRAWGEWLQSALEAFTVPADLVGTPTPDGPVPKALKPIFRDRWDLSAGHSLNEKIEAALEGSRHLIVLCSPNSTKSKYVNEEIWRFKGLGRERQIIPIIVGGEPGHAELECFPEALRFDRLQDGTLDKASEPIAADARPKGDDKELALLKVIAGMLNLPLDEVRKRDAIEQRKKVRRARVIAGSMAALALVAIAGAGVAWQQYRRAEEQYQIAEAQRKEAVKRYDQALESTLRLVTTSATFRTLLNDRNERLSAIKFELEGPADPAALKDIVDTAAKYGVHFAGEQIDAKGANSDFQQFLGESKDQRLVWLKLVDVLLNYERDLPAELERYQRDLTQAELPLQWTKHAETISYNLNRRDPRNADVAAKLAEVRKEIVRLGGTPIADCTRASMAGPPNAMPALEDQSVQQAPVQGSPDPCP